MVQVFISCRFSEGLEQAEMLKNALIKEEISCFLCSVHAGDSIGEAVMENLMDAELVVILGTKTYGKKTESKFSTYHELNYILDEDKPYFLVKMCDRFEETKAKFHFTSTIASFPWPPKDHHTLPPDLVPQIKQKLSKVSSLSVAVKKTPTPEEDQLARLFIAKRGSDFSTIVRILQTAANAQVAERGCEAVANIAFVDDRKKKELGRVGAYDAVVKVLKRFGEENVDVAEQGCGAVWNLAAGNADNLKELGRIGACDAVVKALKRFGVENAQVAEKGCGAIWCLAAKNDDNKKELGRIGACDAVVKVLKRFGEENVDVAEKGCGAVWNLAAGNRDNLKELGRIGACDAVVKALKRFGVENAQVAEKGCEAIWCLAAGNRDNQKELGRIGACDAVVKALKRFGVENAQVAEKGCSAIWCLAAGNADNKKELDRVGAHGVVKACKADYTLQKYILESL